jgi:predicted  nucleic acid-binding Zn-ribbon protein
MNITKIFGLFVLVLFLATSVSALNFPNPMKNTNLNPESVAEIIRESGELNNPLQGYLPQNFANLLTDQNSDYEAFQQYLRDNPELQEQLQDQHERFLQIKELQTQLNSLTKQTSNIKNKVEIEAEGTDSLKEFDLGPGAAQAVFTRLSAIESEIQIIKDEISEASIKALDLNNRDLLTKFRDLRITLDLLGRDISSLKEGLNEYAKQELVNPNNSESTTESTTDSQNSDSTTEPESFESRFKVMEDKFQDDYEDEFSTLRRKYERAVEEDDNSDIKRYENKLEDLEDDLKSLDDDLENLEDDVKDAEDTSNEDFDDLLDDIENLMEDIKDLRDNIDDVLSGKSISASSASQPTQNFVVPPQNNDFTGAVTIEPLDLQLPSTTSNVPEVNSGWSNVRNVAWIAAGIVVLLAIIIFLIAVLIL